ncbi:MAG TPA: SMI1/KNR4 family protein [Candidatus Limnocylindrales bacterium]|jgi:hypothetical protein|nr:SMI1/KNR4 family protein [Candidatus Limnocylindrales bacterium]
MTEADFQRIEEELAIKLPKNYKALMANYPFAPDSFTEEFLLPNSVEGLPGSAAAGIKLPPSSFIIGTDGGEQVYFIDWSKESSPVYVFELETGRTKEEAPSLDAYVEKCRDMGLEIKRDEEERARKKWWQFWK